MSDVLHIRAHRGEVPYDHDLDQHRDEYMEEILSSTLVPFFQWKSEKFATWLHDALNDYIKAGDPKTKQDRVDRVNALLMPECAMKEDGYDPLSCVIAKQNMALLKHVYLAFGYITAIENVPYRRKLFLVAQKTGNIQLLEWITEAMAKGKSST